MPMTSKQMIKKLKQNGLEVISQNGSHVKMYNPDSNITLVIPFHSKDLKKGLEHAILKQAELEDLHE